MSLFLAFVMALSMIAPAAAAVAPLVVASTSSDVYRDVDGHWAKTVIETWSDHGVIKGYNGQFSPSNSITRGEMAQIIANLLKLSARAENSFADLDDNVWYTDALLKCATAGIIVGDSANMRPTDTITRQEAMIVLARALGIQPVASDTLSDYEDGAEVAPWASGYMAALVQTDIVSGIGKGLLAPMEDITRASVVTLLNNAITSYIHEPGTYPLTEETGSGIVLVVTPDAVLSGSVPGTLLIGAGTQGGTLTLDGAAVDSVIVAADQVSLRLKGAAKVNTLNVEESASGAIINIDRKASVGVLNKQSDTKVIQSPASGGGNSGDGDPGVPSAVTIQGANNITDLKVGSSTELTLTTAPADATITAVSKNTAVATVTVTGQTLSVTGFAKGSTEITVTAKKSGYTDGIVTIQVTVTDPAVPGTVSIHGADDITDLEAGSSTELALMTTPDDATITAVSKNTAVATVTVTGQTLSVTGVAQGSTEITVTAKKSGYTDGTGTFQVTVTEAEVPGTIIIQGIDDIADLKVGSSTEIVLTVDPDDTTITAASGNTDVATVTVTDQTLSVTGVAQGNTEITVTAKKSGYTDGTATFQVTVTEAEVVESGSRMIFNFNADWKFSKGHGYDNAESNRATKQEVIVLPKTDKPYETGYAMGSTWESVSLPHTYNDVDTFDNFTEQGMNGERSVYGGTAWYKKTFTIPEEYAGKKIFLEFEAARQAAEVYLNGVKLEGKSENGFIPFGYDLTAGIKFGEENDITVMTDNAFPYYHIGEDGSKNELSWADSHWHPNSGGLYRNATLYVTEPLHVTLPLYSFLETQGTYVYTKNETKNTADVVMEAEIANEDAAAKTFTYVAEVLDAEGKPVLTVTSDPLTLAPGAKQVFSLTSTLQNPKRWSTEYPYLYTVMSKVLVDGKEIDGTTTPLGVRTFRFTNDSGFFLNENYVKLQGWGQKPTDEWAGLGAAYPDWMHAFTQELMKDAGGNFIRWGHSAASPTQIAISDQYGIVTLQPGVDGEGSTVGGTYSELSYAVRKDAFRDMLIYYRNNPSIFLWELGNQSMPDAEAHALSDLVYEYDGHGMAAADKKNSGTYDATETASNRLIAVRRGNAVMSKYVDVSVTTEGDWELKANGKPGVEGEYNREEARRGVWDRYTTGFETYKTASGSSYNLTTEEFAINQAKNYAKISASAHSGGANWIFSDSTSHGRVYSEVSRASGEVDAVRLEKETYYTLKTIFNDDPDVYLVGHWNYLAGTVKDVYATSNAFSVKLIVTDADGKTTEYTGTKSNGYLFTFKNVVYTPGTITAVAYDKTGNQVAKSIKRTHGEPVALKLTPIVGPEGLLANGSDILLLDVEVVDAQGNRCLTFDGTVNGKKTMFVINDDNGSSIWRGGYNSGIEHSTNKKELYIEAGITRVAIRTTMVPGDIMVTAKTDGLTDATITITSKAIDNTDGLNSVRNQFKQLPLDAAKDPGLGHGERPAVDDGTVTEQKSALIGDFFYTGGDAPTKIAFPAVRGSQVYSDDKSITFGELPIELLNSEYLQLPQADANLLGATDVIQLSFQRNVNLYIAHDDAIDPMPGWFAENGYIDTGMDITVNGKNHSVYQKAFLKDDSVTLFSNVDGANFVQGGNQYVVFIKEQGQEKTFLMDNFDGQAVDQPPLGWMVSTAENTSAKIAEIDGNKVLELYDTNTNGGMAIVSRKFLPQYGKFSLEYKICDYDLKVDGKAQDYVRIFLLKDPPSTVATEHGGTVVESYIRAGSSLEGRQEYPTRVDKKIKTLTAKTWYTVKYIVDVGGANYDVYVDNVLLATGIKFRNNHPYVDHLVLGSGGGTGTHVLIDDVKIELMDNALSGVTVNGNNLPGLAAETLSYNYTLPVGTTEAPEVAVTARDPYATVEVTQAADPNGTATIEVTALNGDVRTYTVQFTVASEVNKTVSAILLDGKALKGFAESTGEYDIVLPTSADYPDVTITQKDPADVVEFDGQGTGTVTITVNGIEAYTLNFTHAAYALDGFGTLDESIWTKGSDGSSSIDENGVVTLADSGSTSTFLWGKLDKTYDDDSLKGKKIVMEWDVTPHASQTFIRNMLTKDTPTNQKAQMVNEFYINLTTANTGNVMYKNSADGNVDFTPSLPKGFVKNGAWNHIKMELSTDTGVYTVTVTNSDGATISGSTAANTVRKTSADKSKTEITHVHFGTGGAATGNVLYKNVKVYVCSDY
jgi:beta-galactosidase